MLTKRELNGLLRDVRKECSNLVSGSVGSIDDVISIIELRSALLIQTGSETQSDGHIEPVYEPCIYSMVLEFTLLFCRQIPAWFFLCDFTAFFTEKELISQLIASINNAFKLLPTYNPKRSTISSFVGKLNALIFQ